MISKVRKIVILVAIILIPAGLGVGVILWGSDSDQTDEFRHLHLASLAGESGKDRTDEATAAAIESKLTDVLLESSLQNRYTVLYFYDAGRSGSRTEAKQVASMASKLPHSTAWLEVDVKDQAMRPILTKYGIRAEPVTLILAPNGAVTAGLTGAVSAEMFERGLVSPKTAEVFKAIQAEKIVFLTFVGPKLTDSDAVRQAAQQAAVQMAGISSVIEINPQDQAEKKFLEQCGISPDSKVAHTLVISPRGAVVRRFHGAITPQHLYDAFQSILAQDSGCGSEPITGGSACQPARGATGQSTCN